MALERATTTQHTDGAQPKDGWAWINASAAIAAGAALGVLVWNVPLDAGAPLHLPLWLIIAMVAGAEVTVVHLEHTRDHSFSLREIPIALGLFYASSPDLLIGSLLGTLIAATLHRRERTSTLVFGLGRRAIQVGVAIVVFGAVIQDATPVSTRGWLAALLATLVACVLPTMLAGLTPAGGRATLRQRAELLVLTATASGLNTSLAIVMTTVLWSSPVLWWVAVVPPAVLLTAYRASISHRVERQRLEQLYEASRLLHASPQVEDALVAAAEQAQAMFGVADVKIVVIPESGEKLFHTLLTADGIERVLEPVERSAATRTLGSAWGRHSPETLRNVPGLVHTSPEVQAGMSVPLFDDNRFAGVMLVANRINQTAPFSAADSRLLQAFSQHLAVSIENGRLEDSLAELTRLKEKLRHQASHDALTGIANRTLFTEQVDTALEESATSGRIVGVLFLDLDDFKTVNDSLGHAAGDELLRQASRRIEASVRPGGLVARFGGDEFAVLLERVKDPTSVIIVADRIKRSLSDPFVLGPETVSVTASIGVALGTGRDHPTSLIRHADTAMYAAKRQSKGRVRVYEARMHEAISKRLSMQSDLASAIEDQQLTVAYQPIVDLESGMISGFEALLRWVHPTQGPIEPSQFIPFAEETGLIVPLGEWVMERAVEQSAIWRSAHPNLPIRVAANLSPRQLTEGDVARFLADVLTQYNASPQGLTVEITENTVMQAPIAAVEAIRDLGVSLAVDDFGTGYSSLSYLDRLPIDILKIDKSFVARIGSGKESPLIRTILQLGNALGLETVVEGIETRAQLERLRTLRAGAAQGFYLAPPMDAGAIDALLTKTWGQVLRPLGAQVRHLRDVSDRGVAG